MLRDDSARTPAAALLTLLTSALDLLDLLATLAFGLIALAALGLLAALAFGLFALGALGLFAALALGLFALGSFGLFAALALGLFALGSFGLLATLAFGLFALSPLDLFAALAFGLFTLGLLGLFATLALGLFALGSFGLLATLAFGLFALGSFGLLATLAFGLFTLGPLGLFATLALGLLALGLFGLLATLAFGLFALGPCGLLAALAFDLFAALALGLFASCPLGLIAALALGLLALGLFGLLAALAFDLFALSLLGLSTALALGLIALSLLGLSTALAFGLLALGLRGLPAALAFGLPALPALGLAFDFAALCALGQFAAPAVPRFPFRGALAAVFLQRFEPPLLEPAALAPLTGGFPGTGRPLLAVAAEPLGDFRVERTLALDGDPVEIQAYAPRAEGFIPLGVDPRRGHGEAVPRPARVVPAAAVAAAVEVEPIVGDVPARAAFGGRVFRPAVHDDIVVDVDVGDVGGVPDEVSVPRNRQAVLAGRAAEVAVFDEVEPGRTDSEGDLHPRIPAAPAVGERFGRQRRPADVAAAFAPGDPCRRPFMTRHPDPAVAAQQRPAPVVVGGPAEGFVGHPRPAVVGADPVAAGVGPPVGAVCGGGLPDVSVIRRPEPRAVWIERIVKNSEIGDGRGRALESRIRRCEGVPSGTAILPGGRRLGLPGGFRLSGGEFVGGPVDFGLAVRQRGLPFLEFERLGALRLVLFGFERAPEFDQFGALAFDGVAFLGEAHGVDLAFEFGAALAFLACLPLQFGEAFGRVRAGGIAVAGDHAEAGGDQHGGG